MLWQVTLTNELAGMLGKKKLTKGVKVQMELGVVHVDMMISVTIWIQHSKGDRTGTGESKPADRDDDGSYGFRG